MMEPIITLEIWVKIGLPLIGLTVVNVSLLLLTFNRKIKSIRQHEGEEKALEIIDKSKREYFVTLFILVALSSLFLPAAFLVGMHHTDALFIWGVMILVSICAASKRFFVI